MRSGYSYRGKILFSLIAFIGFCGAFFMGSFLKGFTDDWYKFMWLALLFMLPLVLHSVVAFGFSQEWFDIDDHDTTTVINLMEISVRVFALFAIFDLIMRLTQHTEWMLKSITPFIGDSAWILLLILWTGIHFTLPDKVFQR